MKKEISMKSLTQIRRKHCPYCNKRHHVEYVADCLIQFMDGSRLKIYKCPKTNKEFRVKE